MQPGSRKVAAYIIRQAAEGKFELLIFAHRDFPDVPIQVPAGTIDEGEEILDALYREIEEESGLVELELVRKLGVHEFIWPDSGHAGQRHFYLLRAPVSTPDAWDHVVHGDGEDNGMAFSYRWACPDDVLHVPGNIFRFITPGDVPELFTRTG